MSFFGIALEDMERAKEENILTRGVNAVEKGNYLCVLTGGGFRLYDKNDYALVLKENGMSYIYDCEFSDDLTMMAIKSWNGYAIFYDLIKLEKIKRISLLNKKNNSMILLIVVVPLEDQKMNFMILLSRTNCSYQLYINIIPVRFKGKKLFLKMKISG